MGLLKVTSVFCHNILRAPQKIEIIVLFCSKCSCKNHVPLSVSNIYNGLMLRGALKRVKISRVRVKKAEMRLHNVERKLTILEDHICQNKVNMNFTDI